MEKFLEIKYLKIKYKTLDEEKTVLDIEHLEIEKGDDLSGSVVLFKSGIYRKAADDECSKCP